MLLQPVSSESSESTPDNSSDATSRDVSGADSDEQRQAELGEDRPRTKRKKKMRITPDLNIRDCVVPHVSYKTYVPSLQRIARIKAVKYYLSGAISREDMERSSVQARDCLREAREWLRLEVMALKVRSAHLDIPALDVLGNVEWDNLGIIDMVKTFENIRPILTAEEELELLAYLMLEEDALAKLKSRSRRSEFDSIYVQFFRRQGKLTPFRHDTIMEILGSCIEDKHYYPIMHIFNQMTYRKIIQVKKYYSYNEFIFRKYFNMEELYIFMFFMRILEVRRVMSMFKAQPNHSLILLAFLYNVEDFVDIFRYFITHLLIPRESLVHMCMQFDGCWCLYIFGECKCELERCVMSRDKLYERSLEMVLNEFVYDEDELRTMFRDLAIIFQSTYTRIEEKKNAMEVIKKSGVLSDIMCLFATADPAARESFNNWSISPFSVELTQDFMEKFCLLHQVTPQPVYEHVSDDDVYQ